MASKENTAKMVEILRVEGIMAQGYGLNPKIVMRDKRLTTTAKCIYSYIASFAGGGNQAFPNRDMILDELRITKDTYYKHMRILTDTDYIRIERTKGINGAFDKNIYILVATPNPTQSEQSNSGNTKINEEASDQGVLTAGKQKKPGIKRLQVKEKASVKELRERLEIDNLKQSDPAHAEIIEDIFMAVEDMDASEQITISGNIKKRDAIQNLLNQLTADHIRLVTQIMAKNKKTLINRKSYIQTCVANSIFDTRSKNIEADNFIKEKQKEETAEEKEQLERESIEKQKLLKKYEQYPELKVIDDDITEIVKKISKAVLCKNNSQINELQREKERLLDQRKKYDL